MHVGSKCAKSPEVSCEERINPPSLLDALKKKCRLGRRCPCLYQSLGGARPSFQISSSSPQTTPVNSDSSRVFGPFGISNFAKCLKENATEGQCLRWLRFNPCNKSSLWLYWGAVGRMDGLMCHFVISRYAAHLGGGAPSVPMPCFVYKARTTRTS